MGFKDGFTWGVATASYQIEGAVNEGGRGDSVWDMVCRKPGFVWQGHTGSVACDHYHRYKEDVKLMQTLGVQAYRFSVAWPRIQPMGTGPANEEGIGFYDRLVDELLAAGITPWATLFHWDLPTELYRQGGWLNPNSPAWFEDYTQIVVDRLSDRVSNWFTLNEPQCFIGLGMWRGEHAPGDKLQWGEVLLAAHHSMIAHGRAVQTIRSRSKLPAKVGCAPVGSVYYPATNTPEDIEAARELHNTSTARDPFTNTWWMDPLVFGAYPEDGLRAYHSDLPKFSSSDFDEIKQPLDFYGVNLYSGTPVVRGADGRPQHAPAKAGDPITLFHWWVRPEAMYWGPKFYFERYQLPLIVTENGLSNPDWVALDGKVHDPQRIDFLHRYLLQLLKLADEGVPIDGYFQWSLMDNFEWAEGYKQRFGLVHIDYQTQVRTPKDSFYWYQSVIQSNGAKLRMS